MKRLSLAFALLCSAWLAAAETAPATETENMLDVTADRMEVLLDGKTIELTTNVRFEDNTMILTADRMLILLDEETDKDNDAATDKNAGKAKDTTSSEDGANMKLKRMEAFGNVVLRKKSDATESAMGDKAMYDVKTDTVTLTGDCLITQGDRSMKGDEVVFDRTNQRINVKKAAIRIKLKNKKDKGLGDMLGSKTKQPTTDKKAP